jgi:hypothetical protein
VGGWLGVGGCRAGSGGHAGGVGGVEVGLVGAVGGAGSAGVVTEEALLEGRCGVVVASGAGGVAGVGE